MAAGRVEFAAIMGHPWADGKEVIKVLTALEVLRTQEVLRCYRARPCPFTSFGSAARGVARKVCVSEPCGVRRAA
jgi:hypothetical protein